MYFNNVIAMMSKFGSFRGKFADATNLYPSKNPISSVSDKFMHYSCTIYVCCTEDKDHQLGREGVT